MKTATHTSIARITISDTSTLEPMEIELIDKDLKEEIELALGNHKRCEVEILWSNLHVE